MSGTDAIQRNKKSALIALLGCSFAIGIVLAGTEPYIHSRNQLSLVQLFGNVLLLGIGFWWLRLDSIEHGVRRSPLLNAGIVLAALIFVPYYFFSTRPQGSRAGPVWGFFALIAASVLCSLAGMVALAVVVGDG